MQIDFSYCSSYVVESLEVCDVIIVVSSPLLCDY